MSATPPTAPCPAPPTDDEFLWAAVGTVLVSHVQAVIGAGVAPEAMSRLLRQMADLIDEEVAAGG